MTANPVKFAIIGVTQPHAAGYAETLLHMPEAEIIASRVPIQLSQRRKGDRFNRRSGGRSLLALIKALADNAPAVRCAG